MSPSEALDRFMSTLRDRQLIVADRLAAKGYRFCDPADERDLGDPVGAVNPRELSATRVALQEAGIEIPAALTSFWRIVGSLEFQGIPPTTWSGCQYSDPISILPVDAAYMHNEIEAWRECAPDEGKYSGPPGHFWFQVAGDHIHKAGYSGGGYYLSFDESDPRFFGERFDTRFTTYLRTCADWAGFPGLADCPNHKWPLDELLWELPALDPP